MSRLAKRPSGHTPVARLPVLVSGLQPTGRLHIGNYLGMLHKAVELQNSGKYQCYYFLADLHSLTEQPEPKNLSQNLKELLSDLLAAGLDPKKAIIFQQSQIPAHSELAWILTTIAPIGELRRMTQYKEKSEGEKESSNAGLLTYPSLMAADIVLYDAKFVPVGEDQLQHLELTRTLARKFNAKFGNTFSEPQPILTETPRIMGLKNPEKKMSKSDPQSCLFLNDSPEQIRDKVMRATTDSGKEIKYDSEKKPGVSNLLKIYSSLSDESVSSLERKFESASYVEFKAALTELVASHFAEFRKKKKNLLAKPTLLKNILRLGSRKASLKANRKIAEVKKKTGLSPRFV